MAIGRGLLSAALVAVLAAGCGNGPATGPVEPDLDFFSRVVFGFPGLVPTVIAKEGGIQLTGLLVTRHAGYALSGALSRGDSRSLVVTVTATETAQGLAFPTQNYYAATVSGLSAVPYDVRVIYIIYRDSRDSIDVLRQTVTPTR